MLKPAPAALPPKIGRPGIPVTIRGVFYENMKLAAEALGVGEETVRTARKRGARSLQGVGLRGRFVPITVDGVVYDSRADAARATGLSYGALRSFDARPDLVALIAAVVGRHPVTPAPGDPETDCAECCEMILAAIRGAARRGHAPEEIARSVEALARAGALHGAGGD
jgi:hypothetical protein